LNVGPNNAPLHLLQRILLLRLVDQRRDAGASGDRLDHHDLLSVDEQVLRPEPLAPPFQEDADRLLRPGVDRRLEAEDILEQRLSGAGMKDLAEEDPPVGEEVGLVSGIEFQLLLGIAATGNEDEGLIQHRNMRDTLPQ